MGMAVLLKYFDRKCYRFTQWGERHPTAVVHPDAVIGERVFLGPYCVIGAHASIGNDCLIGAHAVIENDARIGERTVLHPHVFVGAGCQIGNDCEIHPHTSIGSDGFGYAVDPDGRPRKISHLGNVKIGDGVEIGSNCAVDRATLTSTHIRSGTKLDNICHIAHNCDLGENGFFTAGFMMGGSTKIGRQFVTGGNSVVTAHITLGDNVTLQGRSSVTCDVPDAGAYGGYPLQPLKEAMKTAVNIGAPQRNPQEAQSRHEAFASSRQGARRQLRRLRLKTDSVAAPIAVLMVAMVCFQARRRAREGIVPGRGRGRHDRAAHGAGGAHAAGRLAPLAPAHERARNPGDRSSTAWRWAG